jgi:hypothetical protein
VDNGLLPPDLQLTKALISPDFLDCAAFWIARGVLGAGTMRGRRVLSAILVVLPATVGVATYTTTLKAASDASDCKAKAERR